MRRLLLPLCLAAPLPLAAQDLPIPEPGDDGEGFLTGLIEENLSGVSRTIDITGFEGALSSRATVERLVIADSEGVWLVAEGLVLDWNRSALLRGRLEVAELSAELISVPRAPVPDPDLDLPPPEARPFALPELPVSVNIGELSADRIELGRALAGEDIVASLVASVSLADGEGEATVDLTRTDGVEGRFEIDAAYSNESQVLTLDTTFEEAEGGLVSRTLGLPGAPPLRFDLDGTGPITEFDGELAIATEGVDRIAGTFGSSTEDGDTAYRLNVAGDVTALLVPEFRPFFGDDVTLQAVVQAAEDGSVSLNTLDLSADAVRLEGSAAFGPNGLPVRLNLEGQVGTPGEVTVLPVGEGETRVELIDLNVDYNAATGDDWNASFTIDGFDGEGATIPRLELTGIGTVTQAEGGGLGAVTGTIQYGATGLGFADPALAQAIPADITGEIRLVREEGAPLELPRITLSGDDLRLDGSAQVDGAEVTTQIEAQAGDFSRFAPLADLDLAGSGTVRVGGSLRPLDGIFDLLVTADTSGLAIGIPEVDPLLAGTGTVALAAERDTTGTRITGLTIRTDQAEIDGEATLTSGPLSARINARIEEIGLVIPELSGAATLDVTARRDDIGALLANVMLDAPAGRIDADLSQPGEDAPITAHVEADLARIAPYAALADLDITGAANLVADAVHTQDTGATRITLRGSTEDLSLPDPAFDALLAGSGTVTLTAEGLIDDTPAPTDLALLDLILSVPAADLTVSVAREGVEMVGSVEAEVPDLAVFADVADLPLAGAASFTAEGAWAPESGESRITAQGTTSGLVTGLPQVDPVVEGEGRFRVAAAGIYDGTPQITDLASAEMDIDYPAADATLIASSDGTEIAGTLTANAPELAAFAGLSGLDLAGSADLEAAGGWAPETGATRLRVTAETAGLETGLPQVDPIVAGGGSLNLAVRGTWDGTPDPEDLGNLDAVVSYPAVTAQVNATGGAEIGGSVRAEVPDIVVFSGLAGREMTGRVRLDGEGAWTPETGDISVTLDAESAGVVTGFAQVDGIVAGSGTVDVTADLRLDDSPGAEDVTRLDLDIAYPAVTARVQADNDGSELAGTADAEIPDLGVFSGLAGRQLGGALDLSGSGAYAPGTGDVRAELTGTTSNLRLGLADIDPLLAGSGTIRLDTALTLDDTPGPEDLRRLMLDLAYPVADATVDVTEDGNRLTGTVTAQLPRLAAFSNLANTSLSGSGGIDLDGSYDRATGAFEADLTARTVALGIGNPTVNQLTAGVGTVTGAVDYDGNGAFTVTGARVDYPNITASADAQTDGTNGTADFAVRLRDVGLFTDALSGPVSATGTARQAGGTWSVNTGIDGPGGANARIDGQVAPSLALDITGSLPLALANAVLDPRRLNGTARLNLSVDGPPALSSVSGTVGIEGARLADPNLPIALEEMNGTVGLSGGAAQVDISARSSTGGRLRASGPIQLSGGFDAGLSIAVERLRVRDPNLYETRLDGTVTVTGPLAGGARIAGRIDVGQTEIQVPSSGVGALGDLPEVTHVGAPPPVRRTLDRAGLTLRGTEADAGGGGGGGSARPYPLDLVISAPSRLFIRGRGLDAELGGTLTLTGTTADIIPSGQFDLIRGRIDILQQRFELDEGSVTLQGDFTPFIRLVVRTETEDGTTVEIIVEGEASSPEVRFASTPDLPQDEVLSRLLFGRSVAEISPLQAVQLAGAVGTLAGRGGGGIVNRFREGLDLDDLDLTTDDAGNAAVRAGKYLSENVYTEVTVGSDGETEIDLNIDLTDSVTARGTVGADGETSLGIFYERDY